MPIFTLIAKNRLYLLLDRSLSVLVGVVKAVSEITPETSSTSLQERLVSF